MASAETVHCNRCKKDVEYHCNPVNHGRQLFITLITAGLWAPVWFGMVFRPTKLCNECDSPIWDDAK